MSYMQLERVSDTHPAMRKERVVDNGVRIDVPTIRSIRG